MATKRLPFCFSNMVSNYIIVVFGSSLCIVKYKNIVYVNQPVCMPVIVLHDSIIVFMGSEWIVHSRCLLRSPRTSTVSIVKYEIIHSIPKIVLTCKVLLLGKYESMLVVVYSHLRIGVLL